MRVRVRVSVKARVRVRVRIRVIATPDVLTELSSQHLAGVHGHAGLQPLGGHGTAPPVHGAVILRLPRARAACVQRPL